ncbi:MAG: signal peptidase I [Firmicutes bacterium]|nr:signal peptidase I [Bacillota bacterium]
MGKKRKLNLPQEFSVEERGKDIKEGTKGSRMATIAGASFFTITAGVSIFLIVFTILFMFSRVYGPSMMTILNANYFAGERNHDAVIVSRYRAPVVNDIIVTRFYSDQPGHGEWQRARDGRWFQLYIKRLIATEGQSVYVGNRRMDGDNWVVDIEINGEYFAEHPDVDESRWGINVANPATSQRRADYFYTFWRTLRGERTASWDHMVGYNVDRSRYELVIPDGYVFYIGDNRRDSHDGRAFGPQPASNIVGVAVDFARNRQSLPGWLWSQFVYYITFQWV